MKVRNKENSKSKNKVIQKKNSNGNEKKYDNPFYPIKYFCFNDVKKIVNSKRKKSPFSKNNEKPKNIKIEKTKKEEEDDYNKKIYNKKLIIPFHLSSKNLSRINFNLDKYEIKNYFKSFSTDERYKILKKYGLFTKKIINNVKNKRKTIRRILIFKKSKFSKHKAKKKIIRNKTKFNNYKYIDVNEISNINNLICRAHTINEFDNNLTNNNITCKITTNNTMNNYVKSYLINNSMPNKSVNKNNNNKVVQKIKNNIRNNVYMQVNKINNIKIINNISKTNEYRNQNRRNDENGVYVRRIILEEKFTIDSKGDKKTIYIKKINPVLNTKELINSHEKRKKNKNINKIKIRNNKDNPYINHNDIINTNNINMNVCSFQKININKNKINNLLHMSSKMDSYDEENKALSSNNNINNNSNATILQNYKYYLNIKNGNKIFRPKPNGILYKSENNRKSHQNLFHNSSKKMLKSLNHSEIDRDKKKSKSKTKINNSLVPNTNKKISKRKKNRNLKYNSPIKHMNIYPQYFKNKVIHRKTKTNCIIPNSKEDNKLIPEEDIGHLSSQRSLSFIGRVHLNKVTKKIKNVKKIEKKENFDKINFTKSGAVLPYTLSKIDNYFHISSPKDEINSKNCSKINTFANGNNSINCLKKINYSYKSKQNVNDLINDSSKYFYLNNNKSQK